MGIIDAYIDILIDRTGDDPRLKIEGEFAGGCRNGHSLPKANTSAVEAIHRKRAAAAEGVTGIILEVVTRIGPPVTLLFKAAIGDVVGALVDGCRPSINSI